MTQQQHHSPHRGGSLGVQGNRSPGSLIIILVGGLVVIAGAIVVVVMMNRGTITATPPPVQPAVAPMPTTAPIVAAEPELPKAGKVPPKADVTATAEEIIDKYTEAGKAFDAGAAGGEEAFKKVTDMYQGKIVEVTGQVFGKSDSELVGYAISLAGGIERTRGVRCVLAEENKPQLIAIATGQTVTIRGKCKSLSKDIELTDCAVIAIKNEE